MTDLPPHAPVLVGVGVSGRREDDPRKAPEALDLMLEAARRAACDSGAPGILKELDGIAIPQGRWRYRNPAGALARDLGASRALTILSSIGVLQQTLIAQACENISSGAWSVALVAGADTGYRLLRAKLAGVEVTEAFQEDEPDLRLEPAAELRHPAERAAGLQMPVGLYALIESARRAKAGLSVAEHRERLARRILKFAQIAAENPSAWKRGGAALDEIRDAGPRNPMQAFPYTRAHCSDWNVDQGSALLFCSVERAEALGVPRRKWVFPLASAEANHMIPTSARKDLVGSPGAAEAARAVFEASGVSAADVDLVDLYSCFPAAVDTFAQEAALPTGRDLTFTGGMPYAGGPYNNYVLQTTARAAELLRTGPARTALISCVSGIMTKQAFAVWSADPPAREFERRDVTATTAARAETLEVVDSFEGEARVAACTAVYTRGAAPYAVALLDIPSGARCLAVSRDVRLVSRIEREECVGRRAGVVAGELAL